MRSQHSARAASVPVAVHLDHATNAEHLELAIGLAEKEGIKFDSIMVDASHADVSETTSSFLTISPVYKRPPDIVLRLRYDIPVE
jgi:fructose/tagatose bisphosphate aldolase